MKNIAEILKDCPKGTKLYCTIYGYVEFIEVRDTGYAEMIFVNVPNKGKEAFYDDGRLNRYYPVSECVLFPSKENRDWRTFKRPFKDGDIVYIKTKCHNHNEFIIIFQGIKNDHIHKYACFAYQELSTSKAAVCHLVDVEFMRLGKEEEKQKLFNAIKENGYKWNTETKTLEKLIEPKFKVGDWVEFKYYERKPAKVKRIENNMYYLSSGDTFMFQDEHCWELTTKKFDIATLKPFTKVLVRDNDTQKWTVDLFSFYDKTLVYPFSCVGHYTSQCISYDGNEHLLGTSNDCDEYYKNW